VEDHFAILKVGPALTFAFREAIFTLAMMEGELFPNETRSNIVRVLDDVMVQRPEHWEKYYRGSEEEQAFKRKYSFSDRLRYYWPHPQVGAALEKLLKNLGGRPLPLSLLSQFAPVQYEQIRRSEIQCMPEAIISSRVQAVLRDYEAACGW
jgi:D-tagatose-1,6-bisphosphate aldolase subunit GatZ/KbaZ